VKRSGTEIAEVRASRPTRYDQSQGRGSSSNVCKGSRKLQRKIRIDSLRELDINQRANSIGGEAANKKQILVPGARLAQCSHTIDFQFQVAA
jgi:hypothetical protein